MEEPKIIEFQRRRDFGDKLNITFVFARENFKSFFKAMIYITGPPTVVASLLLSSFMQGYFSMIMGSTQGGDSQAILDYFQSSNFWITIASLVIFSIISSVAVIATTYNYMALYAERKSTQIPVEDVWNRVRGSLGMYFSTAFLYGLMIVLGYVLIFLPLAMAAISPVLGLFGGLLMFGLLIGLMYVVVTMSLIFPIRAFEGLGFFDAMSRSFRLVKEKWWSTFGVTFVLSLVAGVVSYIFLIPGMILQGVAMIHEVSEGTLGSDGSFSPAAYVLNSLAYLTQYLLYFLPFLGLAFQYFNLVELKESRGLISDIDALGKPRPPERKEEHY